MPDDICCPSLKLPHVEAFGSEGLQAILWLFCLNSPHGPYLDFYLCKRIWMMIFVRCLSWFSDYILSHNTLLNTHLWFIFTYFKLE